MSVSIRKFEPKVAPEHQPKEEVPQSPEVAADTNGEKPSTVRNDTISGLASLIASTPDNIEEMKKTCEEAVFVLPEIAMTGNLTIINASYNAGKTLLSLWLLSKRNQAALESKAILYLNADDTYQGAIDKMEFMKSHNVDFLIPGQQGFEMETFPLLIEKEIRENRAGQLVLVLDTMKKFVDPMDKKRARSMMGLLRNFVQAGGTVIALAHTNKHKGTDGSSVAEGVGDFLNDCDAAYLVEVVSSPEDATKTVVFKCTKSRGPNTKKATFTYDNGDKVSWRDRFQSVVSLDGDDAQKELAKIETDRRHAEDLEVIEYVKARLSEGPLSRREITQEDLGNGVSRSRREKVLDRYSDTNGREFPIHWKAFNGTTGGGRYQLT